MTKRPDKIIILGLILVTTLPFLFLFSSLREVSIEDNYSFFWAKLVSVAGSVSGFIGGMLMIWSVVLGIKPVASLVTPDVIWTTNVHKWIGKYGILIAFSHPVFETINYAKNLDWLFILNFSNETEKFITIGRFAFILLLIVYITSAVIRGKLRYRPWKYIHNLAYLAVYFIFSHSVNIGGYLNKYTELKALWLTFFGLFVIATLYRLLEWIGLLRPEYIVLDKTQQAGDIYLVTLKSKNRAIKPLPGQFLILQLKLFGESHPFSIMKFDEDTSIITLGVKSLGGFTKNFSKANQGDSVRLSGPFGVFTREGHNSKPKILMAGGIGITPFIDVINKFANDNTILFYSNKTKNQVLVSDELRAKLGLNYKLFLTGESGVSKSNIVYHRIDSNNFLQSIGQKAKPIEYNYFLCGNKEFMESMIDILKFNGVSLTQIYKEEFTY